MIDQRHLRVQRERAGRAIGRHQRAIAAPYPPVDLGVLVGIHVRYRDPVEFAAVHVGRDRIDHRVPAIAGLETGVRRAVAAAFRGFLGAVVESVERLDEVEAFFRRKDGIKTLLAPRRAGLVDFEIQLFGDLDERIPVRRMQPAAADVEGDIGRRHDGVAASADAIARFQHDDREAGVFQRPRRTEAGCAGADDGDIDFGGEGHAFALARSLLGLKPTLILLSSSAKADDPVFREASVLSQAPAITGCPAFAGHDGICGAR